MCVIIILVKEFTPESLEWVKTKAVRIVNMGKQYPQMSECG